MQINYRREVDGLRAIALLAVMFFHAGAETFGGGFVGVDVFFVISGYLITTIIIAELANDSFSIMYFYERRARRILPTLLFVIAACIPIAWFVLPPSDMKDFGRSLVALSIFSSNILFLNESGYFDTAAELKPLLHTWSLALEEQFYLLLPGLLLLAWRFGKNAVIALLVIFTLVSFGFAYWATFNRPLAAFYLLPTRGWELAIGSLIALYIAGQKKIDFSPLSNQLLGLSGFLLIILAIVAYRKGAEFPGSNALVPTIGAALVIIFAGPNNVVGKFLGSKVLVGIGLVSYSAYLWHYPLFTFARHVNVGEPEFKIFSFLLILSLILGYFSWRFIEKPFRCKNRTSRSDILKLSVIGLLAVFSIGISVAFSDGFINRTVYYKKQESILVESWLLDREAAIVDGTACISEQASICKINSEPGGKKILLVGDSHSADYINEFRSFSTKNHIDAWQMSIGGCSFISHNLDRNNSECGKAKLLVEDMVRNNKGLNVIFVASIAEYIARIDELQVDENIDSLLLHFKVMLNNGANIIFFTPRPYFNINPIRAARLNEVEQIRVVEKVAHEHFSRRIFEFTKNDRFKVFDQSEILIRAGCGEAKCFNGYTEKMLPLYRDASHLTTLGARTVFSELLPILQE